MILVDSGVWIDFFRGIDTSGALQLSEILRHDDVLVGDLILVEVLQGFRASGLQGFRASGRSARR